MGQRDDAAKQERQQCRGMQQGATVQQSVLHAVLQDAAVHGLAWWDSDEAAALLDCLRFSIADSCAFVFRAVIRCHCCCCRHCCCCTAGALGGVCGPV
jgi:hypothetical protein